MTTWLCIIFTIYLFITSALCQTQSKNGSTTEKLYNEDSNARGFWTSWINMDNPSGIGDDELYSSIRLRKNYVCGTREPTEARCRVVGSTFVFNEKTSTLVPDADFLQEPCTTLGLLCLNSDQAFGNCKNYEVQFFCSNEPVPTLTDYYGWISLVIISLFVLPIAIALFIKWKNTCLKRRQFANGATNLATGVDAQISTFSPPPTYIDLFPSSVSQLSSTERIYTISDHNHPSTGIENENYRSENEIHVDRSNSTQDSSDGRTSHPTIRLPGMHISVFEIPSSNIYNSLNTPPPSYTEALVIIGSPPHKQH